MPLYAQVVKLSPLYFSKLMQSESNHNSTEKATFSAFRATATSLLARIELLWVALASYMLKKQPC